MKCRACGRELNYRRGTLCRTDANCRRLDNLRVHLERLAAAHLKRTVTSRATLTPKQRERFHDANGWICYLCDGLTDRSAPKGHPDSAVVEHRIPLSRGGNNEPANLGTAHSRCNRDKGNRTADEFFAARSVV